MIKTAQKQLGFGLVEMMIAMLLTLIISAAAITIWISSKSAYALQEDLGRIQENGRFALEFLKYDLRMAGYFGCSNTMPDGISQAIESDGSNLQLRFFSSNSIDIAATTGDLSAGVTTQITLVDKGKKGTHGIHNCSGADIVTATGISNGDRTLTIDPSTLNRNFAIKPPPPTPPPTASVYKDLTYAINSNAVLTRNGEELVEGVERMELLFGISTDADTRVDRYVDATAITDWNSVISVRLALLIRSVSEYGTASDDNTYLLLNSDRPYGPIDDRRRRRVFTTTVKLRNHE